MTEWLIKCQVKKGDYNPSGNVVNKCFASWSVDGLPWCFLDEISCFYI